MQTPPQRRQVWLLELCVALLPQDEVASRRHSEGVSLLLPLWAAVPSQRVGPVARGPQVTQDTTRGHPAEAVGVVVGFAAVGPGPQAQCFPKGLPEAAGHEAVEHRIGGRAEVEEDARDNVHILEGQEQALGLLGHEAPHEAVNVEWSPADPEHYDEHNCGERGRHGCLWSPLNSLPGFSVVCHSRLLSYLTGHPHPSPIRKFLEICLHSLTPFEEAALITVTD